MADWRDLTTTAPAPAAATPAAPQTGGWRDISTPVTTPAPADASTKPVAPVDPNAYAPPSWLPGAGWLHNAGNEIDDALTHGYADVATSKLGGPDIDTLRAQTAQGRKDLGPIAANAIDIATAMTGGIAKAPAAVADLARAATGSKLAGYGAGVLASGAQGAGESALTAFGHGGSAEDAKSSAKWGGTIGALLGLLGVGSAAAPAAAKSSLEAGADQAAAYSQMKPIGFDATDIAPAYRRAWNALTPSQINDLTADFRSRAGTLADQLNMIKNRGGASADTLDGFARNLQTAAKSSGDGVLANKIEANIRGVMDNATPVTNHPVGLAGELQDQANTATSQAKNAEMLEEAQRVGGLPGGGGQGASIPAAAQNALKNDPQFFKGDNEAAMRSLAGAGQFIPSSWLLKHAVGYPIAGALAGGIFGAGHGYATGGADPWAQAGKEALEYGGTGFGVAAGAPLVKNYLVRKALSTAAPTLTAGAPYGPPQAPVNQLLQAILHSR